MTNPKHVLWRRFRLGMDFFLDPSPDFHLWMSDADCKQIRRKCRKTFNRRLSKGGGDYLADRHGKEICFVASYGLHAAKWAWQSIDSKRRKQREVEYAKWESEHPVTGQPCLCSDSLKARIQAVKDRVAGGKRADTTPSEFWVKSDSGEWEKKA